jgi:hypothetical protein
MYLSMKMVPSSPSVKKTFDILAVYNFANTHNRKVAVLALFGYRRQHFFFSRKPIFFNATLIQLLMAVIKIKFSIIFWQGASATCLQWVRLLNKL